jgi:hypothetical protein
MSECKHTRTITCGDETYCCECGARKLYEIGHLSRWIYILPIKLLDPHINNTNNKKNN